MLEYIWQKNWVTLNCNIIFRTNWISFVFLNRYSEWITSYFKPWVEYFAKTDKKSNIITPHYVEIYNKEVYIKPYWKDGKIIKLTNNNVRI